MRWMWPHRSLIDAGVPAPGHSDAYICRPDPFTAMWAMVTRRTESGASLDASEAVSVAEALRAYTSTSMSAVAVAVFVVGVVIVVEHV
jgi:predicted amidohydrolase YtcJ